MILLKTKFFLIYKHYRFVSFSSCNAFGISAKPFSTRVPEIDNCYIKLHFIENLTTKYDISEILSLILSCKAQHKETIPQPFDFIYFHFLYLSWRLRTRKIKHFSLAVSYLRFIKIFNGICKFKNGKVILKWRFLWISLFDIVLVPATVSLACDQQCPGPSLRCEVAKSFNFRFSRRVNCKNAVCERKSQNTKYLYFLVTDRTEESMIEKSNEQTN